MKKKYCFILLIVCLFIGTSAFGQEPAGQGRPERKLTGTVMDGSTKTPMAGANVLIKTVTDSLLLGTVTDGKGYFEIVRPAIPSVKIEIKFIGFETITRVHSGRDPLDLVVLTLAEDAQVLGEVVIEGQSPLGEMRGGTTSSMRVLSKGFQLQSKRHFYRVYEREVYCNFRLSGRE